jgi:phosphoenolpyruvate phosphomutase
MARKIYTCFCTATIHKGHLNIIAEAAKLGDLTVGVLSDREAIRYNRFPMLSEEERLAAVRALPGVANAVIQRDMMYSDVIDSLRPDVIVHGDNWCNPEAPEYFIRQHVEASLRKYGGEIVDIPYTFDPEAKRIDDLDKERLAMPEYRRRRLRQLIRMCPIVKTIEAHSGLTGLIAEKTVVRQDDGRLDQFDAMWVSSLCDSTAKGKPDIELVDMSSRLRTIDDIMEVTTKPIILDGDTGGLTEHFVYNVRTLERIGVSAVIIEDKTGLKKNSLFGTEVEQTQDTIENFCAKIAAGKDALRTKEFMIIARCESLILEQGMDDALARCHAYVKAGADGIMIHSRRKDPAEILEFCDRFRGVDAETPIVVVPTSFNSVTEAELAAHGVNICIYANQLTRAAFPAMQSVAQDLLKYHRAQEVDSRLMPFKKIITLIDG